MSRRDIACFVCRRPEGRDFPIIRFGLRMNWTPSGVERRRGAGGIYLCERCWKEAQAVRPRRGPRPGFWKGGKTPTAMAAAADRMEGALG